MPKYNTKFELNIQELDLIEAALRRSKLAQAQSNQTSGDIEEEARQIHDLLGKLHNQKTFFRPSKGIYVGG